MPHMQHDTWSTHPSDGQVERPNPHNDDGGCASPTERVKSASNGAQPPLPHALPTHTRKPTDSIELADLEKQKIYYHSWTESSLDLLEKWLQNCKQKVILHNEAAKIKMRKHYCIVAPTLVLSSSASVLSFYSSGDCPTGNDTTQLMSSIFIAMTTLMLGLATLFNFSEKQGRHVTSANDYTNLAKSIQLQIYLPLDRKADLEVFLTSISEQMAQISISEPLL